jgi:RluA family pseudouridine synthase
MRSLPSILYEDESLIAFDKPSGLLVVPDRWDKDLTSLIQLIHEHRSPDIFNAHRLDRETSGVVLCAKTKSALDSLARQFESQGVEKRYVAITLGSPPEDEMVIKRAIAEDSYHPGKMRLSSAYGKPSETHVKILVRWRGYSLVGAFPKTGRTHQIRVHLASVGSPVVADSMYGDGKPFFLSEIKTKYKPKEDEPERPLMGRLALHAQSLQVRHPVTKEMIKIESSLPKDFEISIKYLKRFVGL